MTEDLFGPEMLDLLPTEEFGRLRYYKGFFDQADADSYISLSLDESIVAWKQEKISMYGKEIQIPRQTAWFSQQGLAYSYSGIPMNPAHYPKFIEEIQQKIQEVCHSSFNSVLLNCYRDGSDSVSWHSDDERELGPEIQIASVSLGVSRDFQLRKKPSTKTDFKISLEHGSLLIMDHPFQRYWEHQIPKRKNVIGPRVNLTFRQIQGSDSSAL